MIERYTWRGGSELLLRHGGGSPVTLLVLPALFEEANRMRRFTVSIMRNLARLDIGTILPDLPGTGESLTPLPDVVLADWHDAVAALVPHASGSIAIRGGALLDGVFTNRWRLAPETGARLLRDMIRATAWSDGLTATEIDARALAGPIRLAGTIIGPALYAALGDAVPIGEASSVAHDVPKLWRAAEPGDDPDVAQQVAEDIAAWTITCATS